MYENMLLAIELLISGIHCQHIVLTVALWIGLRNMCLLTGIGNCKVKVCYVDSRHYMAKACAYSCHRWQDTDGYGEKDESQEISSKPTNC